MKSVNLEPTLGGYKKILALLGEIKNPTKDQKKDIKDLAAYIAQEEQKAK